MTGQRLHKKSMRRKLFNPYLIFAFSCTPLLALILCFKLKEVSLLTFAVWEETHPLKS
jgi:hypothetical protein